MSPKNHYIVCSIAGSDPMGGAGIQGDLKTLAAHGVDGTAVVTAVTVQGPDGVTSVTAISPAVVRAQLEVVLDHLHPHALKTGMLLAGTTARAVAAALEHRGRPLLVVDPVLRASAGGDLSEADLVEALRDALLPCAAVVTPNADEAAALLGVARLGAGEIEDAARAILLLGADAVILTGGDADADPVVDLVATRDRVDRLEMPRIAGVSPHGTGCAFASALAARLAVGAPVLEAARGAKRYVHAAIEAAVARGTPNRLVHDVAPSV